MSTPDPKTLVVRAADMQGEGGDSYSHPLNPQSQVRGMHLSARTGLQRAGVSYVTVAPGKESFAYHSHTADEEWVYILRGRAVAEIDDTEVELEAGDFVGYPTGVAHHLRNPYDDELVYLMGGENHPIEVADFPRHGKRMVRRGDSAELHEIDAAEPFWRAEEDD